MVYSGPTDRRDLLDAYGDEGNVSIVGSIKDKDASGFERLETNRTKGIIAVTALRFIPDNHAATGMNTRDYFLLNDASVANSIAIALPIPRLAPVINAYRFIIAIRIQFSIINS